MANVPSLGFCLQLAGNPVILKLRRESQFRSRNGQGWGKDLFRALVGRGCAYADIDGNGYPDIVLMENSGSAITFGLGKASKVSRITMHGRDPGPAEVLTNPGIDQGHQIRQEPK